MLEVKLHKTLAGRDFAIDISFSAANELVAVTGPSGSGKTTTLKLIAGLLQPQSGRITLNGKTLYSSREGINIPPGQRRIGFVFQNLALFPHLNVSQNIGYGISHLSRQEREYKVRDLLKMMELESLATEYPGRLSGGQQQRVALARALAPEPELLLLDEPFSALDCKIKRKLQEDLLDLQRRLGITTLLVTHDLHEAEKLSNLIIVIEEGKVIRQSVYKTAAHSC